LKLSKNTQPEIVGEEENIKGCPLSPAKIIYGTATAHKTGISAGRQSYFVVKYFIRN
jgi:Ni,Fe-hydrogenase III small subunit